MKKSKEAKELIRLRKQLKKQTIQANEYHEQMMYWQHQFSIMSNRNYNLIRKYSKEN